MDMTTPGRWTCVAVAAMALPAFASQVRSDPVADMLSYVERFTGVQPMDCGLHLLQPRVEARGVTRVAAPEEALGKSAACGVDAARERKPFWTFKEEMGIDSWVAQGLFGTAEGTIYRFHYDSAPCGGPGCAARFSVERCDTPLATTASGNRGESRRTEFRCTAAASSGLDQSNVPGWTGGWTVIGRGTSVARLAQTVTSTASLLIAVEIDVLTGNRGRGGDDITVKVVDGERVLGTASRSVPEGHDGMLRFDFPQPGVTVTPGAAWQLQVEDTNRDVFGWRYGENSYPGGVALFNGTPWNNGVYDFRFRTYGN